MSYVSLYPDIGYPESDPGGFVINYPGLDPVEKYASGTPLETMPQTHDIKHK